MTPCVGWVGVCPGQADVFLTHKRWYHYDYRSPWRKLGTAKCSPQIGVCVRYARFCHARPPRFRTRAGYVSPIATLPGCKVTGFQV